MGFMNYKKTLSLSSSILIILSTCTVGSISVKDDVVSSSVHSTIGTECHVIDGVPYVGQETDFYCVFASPTMIFRYYGINTSLAEVLFNSGVGYSMVYSPYWLHRCLIGGTGATNWKIDREFLATLYGLSYNETWTAQRNPPDTCWDKYWKNVKQNITQDRPVLTWVNPVYLSSVQNAVKKALNISGNWWNKIPDFVWGLFPSIVSHMIVLVGFNENNGTVCFNDPAAALMGHPECGTYAWMPIQDFQKAMQSLARQSDTAYMVGAFANTSENPLDKETAFKQAYARNLELMNGNVSLYDDHVIDDWKCAHFGVNALKQLKTDLGSGIPHRITTIYLYKYVCVKNCFTISYRLYKLFDIFLPALLDLSDYHCMANYYHRAAVEKMNVSQYLWQTKDLVDDANIFWICERDAILLSREAENFTKLASNFSLFLEKGIFLTLPCAFPITDAMARVVDEAISIEEEILG
jgi:hypothetical protein